MTDNFVHIEGNLTRDPEMRYTQSGKGVAKLGIAVNRTWFDRGTNERQEEVSFFDAEVWNDQAEHVSASVHKGDRVIVEGALKLNTWTTESGDPRSKVIIAATSVAVSLRFHNATPVRAEKSPSGESSNGSQAPVTVPGTDEFGEEEPF